MSGIGQFGPASALTSDARAASAAKLLRFFSANSDIDGQISTANELVTVANQLLGPEVLIRESIAALLTGLVQSPRADAQLASCSALAACCRFDAVQQDFVAHGGVPSLVSALNSESAAVQVAACIAMEAVARHQEGREALAQTAAARKLLVFARDVLHPAQEPAAAALSKAVGLDSAVQHALDSGLGSAPVSTGAAGKQWAASSKGAGPSGSGASGASSAAADGSAPGTSKGGRGGANGGGGGAEVASAETVSSFVAMATTGSSVSRLQAAQGIRHLCRWGASRRLLVRAGALDALLRCHDHWQPDVPRAAAVALAALTEEPLGALELPRCRVSGIKAAAGDVKGEGGGGKGGGGDDSDAGDGGYELRDGVTVLTILTASSDGATRLAAQKSFANVCEQPANAPTLVERGALELLSGIIERAGAAESQVEAMRGLVALCRHAALSEALLLQHSLVEKLVAAAMGSHGASRQVRVTEWPPLPLAHLPCPPLPPPPLLSAPSLSAPLPSAASDAIWARDECGSQNEI